MMHLHWYNFSSLDPHPDYLLKPYDISLFDYVKHHIKGFM